MVTRTKKVNRQRGDKTLEWILHEKFPEDEKKRQYLDHQKWVKKDKYPYHESDKSEAPEN